MRIVAEKLGPLRSVEVEAPEPGLTIIIGPPSSGKSYILKAAYRAHAHCDDALRLCVKKLISVPVHTEIISTLSTIRAPGQRIIRLKLNLKKIVEQAREALRSCIEDAIPLANVAGLKVESSFKPSLEEAIEMPDFSVVAVAVEEGLSVVEGLEAKVIKDELVVSAPLPREAREWRLAARPLTIANRIASLILDTIAVMVGWCSGSALFLVAGREWPTYCTLDPTKSGGGGLLTLPALSTLSVLRKAASRLSSISRIARILLPPKTNLKLGSIRGYVVEVDGEELPLAAASTSTSEALLLAAAVDLARLRQPALLFIEEPEVQLHPAVVARLPILLGLAVESGSTVMVTTHSLHLLTAAATIAEGPPEAARELVRDTAEALGWGEQEDLEELAAKAAEALRGRLVVYSTIGGRVSRLNLDEVLVKPPGLWEAERKLGLWAGRWWVKRKQEARSS